MQGVLKIWENADSLEMDDNMAIIGNGHIAMAPGSLISSFLLVSLLLKISISESQIFLF